VSRPAAWTCCLVLAGLLLGVSLSVLLPATRPEGPALPEGRPPLVRVWLAGLPQEPTISADGPVRIEPADGASGARLLPRLDPVKVSLAPEGIRLGDDLFPCAALDVRPDDGEPVQVEGRAFGGFIRLLAAGGRLAVINVLDVESYLEGVLGSEMPYYWPAEALKAQAVAARTYALYYCRTRADSPWHLRSTVEDQVYKGGARARSIREAVRATRGEVLLHEGRLFPAFFHSTCGGATESPGKALGKPEFDFLQGVTCPFCRRSPHRFWRSVIGAEDLADRLMAAGVEVGRPIRSVEAVVTEEGGRAVRVTWPEGEVVVPIVDFRRAVGRMRVKSGKFRARREGEEFVFRGRGLGHGAGMCQYGARGMAEAGYTYDSILAHYYRNTELKRLYGPSRDSGGGG